MRKYGKWVLTLGLIAATPGLNFAADPVTGSRARADNQKVAEEIASVLQRGKVKGEISIEYKDGTAILTGSVLDPKVKKLASSLVEQVDNVSRVDNRLTVIEKKRAITERLRNKGDVMQASHEGEKAGRGAIQQVNAEIPAAAPAVNGAAYAPPSSPAGGTSNQEIAEQIGAALSEAHLDGYDIQIRYQNGVAMLDGNVGTPTERATASRVVSSIPGVSSVQNRLACANEPAPPAGARGPQGHAPQQGYGPPQGYGAPQGYGPPRGDIRGAGYMQPGAAPAPGAPGMNGMPMGPGGPPYPPQYGYQPGAASQAAYNSPSMPDYAWPTYAQYPNSAAVTYPQQYSASAWPYIGPFYPYPQVPLGWRDATLRWDDGQWNLMFKPRTDRWWWFFNPNNW